MKNGWRLLDTVIMDIKFGWKFSKIFEAYFTFYLSFLDFFWVLSLGCILV